MSISASSASDATIASRVGRLALKPLRLLASPEPWLAAVFMLSSFVMGIFWFVLFVTLLATGFGLAITLVGIPILVASLYLWVGAAKTERWRVGTLLEEEIADPYRVQLNGPHPPRTFLKRTWALAKDPHSWLDLLYLFLLFPIGIAEFVVLVVILTVPISFLTFPTFFWIGESGLGPLEAIGIGLVGIPLFLAMPYVLVGIGRGHALLAKALLGTDREQELAERVDHLTASRSQAVDVSLSERRRIERDLHDGAQQQLVKLAMDLGMAREKMESDPEAAQALVAEAHEESKRALAEIRNLVRGIHPAVLTDRGLDAAVSALAGRSTIPVSVDVKLEDRPLEAIESAAYFVVAEALTNVARHSQATEALVRIYRLGNRLLVEIIDNGVGGATIGRGTGLSGLADRVGVLDGRLTVDSPQGGPTTVRAELPLS